MWRFAAEILPRRRRPAPRLIRSFGTRWVLPALGLALASYVGLRLYRRA